MKLIACVVLVCFIFLTEAGRIPDDNFEKSNDDVISDNTKNDRGTIQRRKRHSRYYSWDRDMDYRYILEDQGDRIAELEKEIRFLRQQFYEVLSRPPVAPTVVVSPVYCPSSGNKTINDMGNRFGEPVWDNDQEDYNGNRPISLKPQRPTRLMPKQPEVDHGTTQSETTTKIPAVGSEKCKTAILICCGKKGIEKENCFLSFDCPKVYEHELPCSQSVIDVIVRDFIAAYAPDAE